MIKSMKIKKEVTTPVVTILDVGVTNRRLSKRIEG
jgi:hypothetical protein